MAKYSIQDTSLIAIGDAIRNKSGKHTRPGTNILNMPESISSYTPNATGFDTHDGEYLDESLIDVVRFPGASSIYVDCSYQLKFGNTGLDYVAFAPGEYDKKSFPSDAIRFSSASLKRDQITLQNTDVITILFRPYGGADKLGYYAECSALDADGNFMGEYQVEVEGEVPNTLTPAQMATEIEELPTYEPPAEAFKIKNACAYRFSNGGWNWFIKDFGDKITTENITDISYMFRDCYGLEEIPFDINMSTTTSNHNCQSAFTGCNQLKALPNIYNFRPGATNSMFFRCYCIRTLPDSMLDWDFSYINGANASLAGMFDSCRSLRSIPSAFLKKMKNKHTSVYSSPYYNFAELYSLDELIGLPVNPVNYTGNAFSYFKYLSRVKDIIFETNEDGSPIEVTWKSQTIDLTQSFGTHVYTTFEGILDYNSGITADKEVKDDATYQALKDDPDWFTCKYDYSRYDHDSAVRTINSLPDVSSGSGNSIKFRGQCGALTDGGAINTLTEEEIAVAAAKGWTVTFL